jgi:hypothetical protein
MEAGDKLEFLFDEGLRKCPEVMSYTEFCHAAIDRLASWTFSPVYRSGSISPPLAPLLVI